jgi:succinoglycan biosynthesis protein ExoO
MSPLVSVIVAAHNESTFIQKALASVLAQTVENLEVIVVDDGSTDDTAALVAEIEDPRVRLLRNERRLHISRSRNRALDIAQGKWVSILDADDWFLPPRLERLLAAAEENEADLVADDIYFVPDGGDIDLDRGIQINHRGYARPLHRLFSSTHLPHWLTIEELLTGELPGGNDPRVGLVKPLVRRDFLSTHGLRYLNVAHGEQDVPFYLDCLGHDARFLLVGGPWYCYRLHSDMTSKHWSEEDYRRRLAANRQLLTRPYVESNPRLRRLFQQREETLTREKEDYLFARRVQNRSGIDRFRTMLRAPWCALRYLKNRLYETLGHRRAQLRNIPQRLRELAGQADRLKPPAEA